jgi:OPA family glycerol-3-phosphate transporter-like MFS transporter
VLCCALLFGVSGLATLLLFIFYGIGAIPTILAMMLVSGIQGGLNLLLIVYVPKRFCKYGNISTISGVLDAFAYLGAAASTWGVALVAENAGWRATIGVWLGFSAIGILCCLLAARPWKRFYRQ